MTSEGSRNLADPPPPPDRDTYRARLLAHSFDTYAEAWNVRLRPEIWAAIVAARIEAEEADAHGRDGALVELGGREFRVMPYGAKGGVQFILDDARVRIAIASMARDYPIAVRYLSAGLWGGGGISERRMEVAAWLRENATAKNGEDWEPALSRFDYAFDFHAPDFTQEAQGDLRPRFLAPAHTKWSMHGEGRTAQTFTFGKMPRLQVQIYDKAAEIVQASGKDWLHLAWASGVHVEWPNGKPDAVAAIEAANPFLAGAWHMPEGDEPARDVWRLELRYGGEWLKERGIRGFPALQGRLAELLSAAIIDRRLTANDPRRVDLRPIHPLWWWAHQAAGAATTVPKVIAYSTLQREEYRDLMVTQFAGMLRSGSVSQLGTWSVAEAERLFRSAMSRAENDPDARRKIKRARARFRHLGRLH